MPEVLDEGGIVGVFVFLALVMSFPAHNAGIDLCQRVKERDVSARCFFQGFGRGVDCSEGARRLRNRADDGIDMRMPLGSGKDGVGVVGECLFQSRIGRVVNNGVKVGA